MVDEFLRGLEVVDAAGVLNKSLVGGCQVVKLPKYQDKRGWLISDVSMSGRCVQVVHSLTWPGMARDIDTWHVHQCQTDRFIVLRGMVVFGLSDGEETARLVMSDYYPYRLHIPPKVYHCYRVMGSDPGVVMNVPTELYNPNDEGRVPFLELEVDHPWLAI